MSGVRAPAPVWFALVAFVLLVVEPEAGSTESHMPVCASTQQSKAGPASGARTDRSANVYAALATWHATQAVSRYETAATRAPKGFVRIAPLPALSR